MAKSTSTKTRPLESSLETLKISPPKSHKPKQTPDSWEDEAIPPTSTSSDQSQPSTPMQESMPEPPPPTPISPTHRHGKSTDWSSLSQAGLSTKPSRDTAGVERRPDKSNVAAGRMIAGALGIKGPKLTDEQRNYERVTKEKVRKKAEMDRSEAQRREREQEEARKAIWDD